MIPDDVKVEVGAIYKVHSPGDGRGHHPVVVPVSVYLRPKTTTRETLVLMAGETFAVLECKQVSYTALGNNDPWMDCLILVASSGATGWVYENVLKRISEEAL